MVWNPFSKKSHKQKTDNASSSSNKEESSSVSSGSGPLSDLRGVPGIPDEKDMNMLQRFAWKRLQKMSPAQQQQLLQKALDPKNIQKHKKEILQMIEGMERSGQINSHQAFEMKKRLGILE